MSLTESPTPPTSGAKATAWLPKAIIGLALLAFIGYFIVYLIYAVELFRFPFDYDQGKGSS